jgi:glyceraldehyde-3-phosphate dehydrogenase (NADP+)
MKFEKNIKTMYSNKINLRNLIAGKRYDSGRKLPVIDKYSREILAEVPLADEEQVALALETAERSFERFKFLSAEKKAGILQVLYDVIESSEDFFTELIVREAGKPFSYAKNEVRRALDNLATGIRETLNFTGETVPMDYLNGKGKTAYTVRVPYGPVLGISPFNFPLNLALHKIIPAVATGSPVIIKPAPQTPLTMFALADIIEKAGVPGGFIQIVLTDNALAEKMVRAPQIKILSFTGSDQVGWYLKSIAGRKKVFLEMGGNAAAIIDETADLKRAAKKLAYGSFLYAGQICISVQRIYVVEKVWEEFKELFLEETARIASGNPADDKTVNGPVISRKALQRIRDWVDDTRAFGSTILTGGDVLDEKHNIYAPTVITGAHFPDPVLADEAFAPLVNINPVGDINEAIAEVNRSRYGLQAAIYSDSLENIRKAIRLIDVGGLMVNEIPGFRIDSMPYGGVKDSGLGREGARYAMREYTTEKLVVIQD